MTPLPPGWPAKSDWTERLRPAMTTESFRNLQAFVQRERATATIYPRPENVFNAFAQTAWANTRVVILGQDPYHGPGQAHGLSFSVASDTRLPPSLRNIFKELVSDIGCPMPGRGDLTPWATQGVLLLNTVLTVRQGAANSHRKKGWEVFTDEVIRQLGQTDRPVVFLLWGKPAEKKVPLIESHHTIITSPHPSPLSAHRGFFGSRPFSRANAALDRTGQTTIDWTL